MDWAARGRPNPGGEVLRLPAGYEAGRSTRRALPGPGRGEARVLEDGARPLGELGGERRPGGDAALDEVLRARPGQVGLGGDVPARRIGLPGDVVELALDLGAVDAHQALDLGPAPTQLALDAGAGFAGLALELRALAAAAALEALEVGLQTLSLGGELALGLRARAVAIDDPVDRGGQAVAGGEGRADGHEHGALGALLDALDRCLGELAPGLGGLARGGGALRGGRGAATSARRGGLLRGRRTIGGGGLAGGLPLGLGGGGGVAHGLPLVGQ